MRLTPAAVPIVLTLAGLTAIGLRFNRQRRYLYTTSQSTKAPYRTVILRARRLLAV
jgi:hypothetical protein